MQTSSYGQRSYVEADPWSRPLTWDQECQRLRPEGWASCSRCPSQVTLLRANGGVRLHPRAHLHRRAARHLDEVHVCDDVCKLLLECVYSDKR
jgi:hypothetical protein